MHRLVLLVLMLSGPAAVYGQAASPGAGQRKRIITVTAGTGNALGWFGLQGERYWARDRLSAFVGAGYTPEIDAGDPSGPTFAAGVRGFTPGFKHRGFLELSVSQLVLVYGFDERRRLYGPGLQAGYQFVSAGGFTLMLSLGLGYAPGVPEPESEVGGMGGLSLGYTWRR
jgi:hypothetical protein